MKFNSDEIASVIQKEIETFEGQMDVREVGTVLEVSDGTDLTNVHLAFERLDLFLNDWGDFVRIELHA